MWEVLIPSSSVNTTPELRIFILTGFLRFSQRFPQINVGGDSAHLSSFGKRTREPRLRSPTKGHVATVGDSTGDFLWVRPILKNCGIVKLCVCILLNCVKCHNYCLFHIFTLHPKHPRVWVKKKGPYTRVHGNLRSGGESMIMLGLQLAWW